MRPRSAAVVVLLLASLTGGCRLSKLSQDADVLIHGRLLAPDGAAQAGTPVKLIKEADVGELLIGVTLFTGTLGAVCFVDEPPAVCLKARTATTDADGRFEFRLKGRDTQGSVGNASTLQVFAGLPGPKPAAGPLVTARFHVQDTDFPLPDLRLWQPTLDVEMQRGRVTATWSPPEPEGAPAGNPRVTFFATPEGLPVWVAEGAPPVALDARTLEDTRGTVAVDANQTAGPGSAVRVTYRSQQVSYSGPARVPLSRGRPCTATGAGGQPVPVQPCPVTDGVLTGTGGAGIGPPEIRPVAGVTVNLGPARPLTFVAVRGCNGTCNVETSPDGQTWTLVGRGTSYFTVTPPVSAPVTEVRVSSTVDLTSLVEVSAW